MNLVPAAEAEVIDAFDVAGLVLGKYGVSERTAQRDLIWARNRLVGELSSTEIKELLAWFCHSTQTIVQKAEAAGAYFAAVAGMNLIYQAVLSPSWTVFTAPAIGIAGTAPPSTS